MGRPKLHDEHTREALLRAAETHVDQDGVDGLSVRRLASSVGTSTRAVYSLFGSRDGLLDALGARAFDLLAHQLDAQAPHADPPTALIEAGASAFRRLVTERPGLLRVALQQPKASPSSLTYAAGERALTRLLTRLERLQETGLLPDRSPREAAWQFHAVCEGLAAMELRGAIPPDQSETAWRGTLTTMVSGILAETERAERR